MRPSTAIGRRITPAATPLHRWAGNQDAFGTDSDSPGALSEGESASGGGAVDTSSFGADDPNMEPNLSPRTTIVMERRLWKVCLYDHGESKKLNYTSGPKFVE